MLYAVFKNVASVVMAACPIKVVSVDGLNDVMT
jgi:hypothetical protein